MHGKVYNLQANPLPAHATEWDVTQAEIIKANPWLEGRTSSDGQFILLANNEQIMQPDGESLNLGEDLPEMETVCTDPNRPSVWFARSGNDLWINDSWQLKDHFYKVGNEYPKREWKKITLGKKTYSLTGGMTFHASDKLKSMQGTEYVDKFVGDCNANSALQNKDNYIKIRA